jgi:hypothetical protein
LSQNDVTKPDAEKTSEEVEDMDRAFFVMDIMIFCVTVVIYAISIIVPRCNFHRHVAVLRRDLLDRKVSNEIAEADFVPRWSIQFQVKRRPRAYNLGHLPELSIHR